MPCPPGGRRGPTTLCRTRHAASLQRHQQREDHQLGQVPIDKLSKADQDYLKGKEAGDAVKKVSGAVQTWNLRNGDKLVGRVVGYARKQMTVQRRRGNIYVNDRLLENLPRIYQIVIPKIVANDVHLVHDDRQALEDWLVTRKGLPQTFTVRPRTNSRSCSR